MALGAPGASRLTISFRKEISLNQRGVFAALRDLEAVGLVEGRREGRARVYRARSLLELLGAPRKTFFIQKELFA
ncbi:MAG: hypothetical protein KatS3mg082_3042 [Nitrospiraceae bacterium]|nr:MAG: hypothetical protein KatS3mg081_2394 [Gemmatimonadales bacterium]GIW56638.1 MAG: hypothetical protein KatS3mg082_3042 [Nitrospiraceae bacterium]